MDDSPGRSLGGLVRQEWPTIIGAALAMGIVAWFAASGSRADTENTLQVMGFDPDRAILLTALIADAIGAAAVAAAGGRFAVALVAGVAGALGFFGPTFRHETGAALRARPPSAPFDPIGWLLSAATVAMVALLVAWSATTLARAARDGILDVAGRLRAGRGRHDFAALGRAAAIAGLVAALAVVVPVFGDMVNYDPDVRMHQGGPVSIGLSGGGPGPSPAAAGLLPPLGLPSATGASGPASDAAGGGAGSAAPPSAGASKVAAPLVAGPLPGSLVTEGALSGATPWRAHPPGGGGRTESVRLPGPWVGGLVPYATIDLYLPPGYDAGTASYPVVYEPHQGLDAWDSAMHITSMLNRLIDGGLIPPVVVVFMPQYGGPYADSECADSWDGREWFDRYVATEVVPWVDSHVRTIARPEARAVMGFSSGGYCSAALVSHHPDLFATSVVFSGYFVAGIHSTTTPVAWRPFNDDPALIAKVSPMTVVPRIAAPDRARLFFILSADAANHFYGQQMAQFAGVLRASGVGLAELPTPLGHSWSALTEQLPSVLEMLAARMATLGVFGGP